MSDLLKPNSKTNEITVPIRLKLSDADLEILSKAAGGSDKSVDKLLGDVVAAFVSDLTDSSGSPSQQRFTARIRIQLWDLVTKNKLFDHGTTI